MKRKRISSDIPHTLHTTVDKRASELGISRSRLIEIALGNQLRNETVEKENQRLIAAQAKLEQEIATLRKQRDTFKGAFEELETACTVAETKITRLLSRNWWHRLANTLPWQEK